jgi:hypothetical protein
LTMSKRVIFVCSQKGGVGKTTFTRGILDLYRSAGLKVAAFDGDGSVGQLVQYYGTRDHTNGRAVLAEQDPLVGVGYFDIRKEDDRDILLNAMSLKADVLLFDLPGETLTEINLVSGRNASATNAQKNAEMFFAAYRDAGYEPIVVIVIGTVKASARGVISAIQAFGNHVHYVVVKSLAHARAEKFSVFDGSAQYPDFGEGRRRVESFGGHIIHMPEMSGISYEVLDFYDLTFSEALKSDKLTIADRVRVSSWLKSMADEMRGTFLDVNIPIGSPVEA